MTSAETGDTEWAADIFQQFVDHTLRLRDLLHLSSRGISLLQEMPTILDVLSRSVGKPSRVERAKEEAQLAKREVEEGFPLLNAHTSIALWSALEATVRLFVARWLLNRKDAMAIEAVQKIRVRLGEFEALSGDDRFFYIVDKLEQELSTPLKNGVNRFESLLEPFGFSGSVHEEDARNIFELSQVRNVLLHRSGVADRRFVEACPWFGATIGQPIHIDLKRVEGYFNAVMHYAVELITRIAEKHGRDATGIRARVAAARAKQ